MRKKTAVEIEAARTLGLALVMLRRAKGLTSKAVTAACGVTCSKISCYETGRLIPRVETLRQLVTKGLGYPMASLYDAQSFIEQELLGREGDDGTLPPDKRPGPSREDGLRLAQEAGKVVAHCCLAFMELQAGGWEERRHGE